MRSLHPLSLAGLTLACALPAHAEVPRVATDLPALAAPVQQVMCDLGHAVTLIETCSGPHCIQVLPEYAGSLPTADLLIRMGTAVCS